MSVSAEFNISTIFGTRLRTLAVPASLPLTETADWVAKQKAFFIDEFKAPDGGGCSVTLVGFAGTKMVNKLGSLAALI